MTKKAWNPVTGPRKIGEEIAGGVVWELWKCPIEMLPEFDELMGFTKENQRRGQGPLAVKHWPLLVDVGESFDKLQVRDRVQDDNRPG